MDVFAELTRIKGRGFHVVIEWDYSISLVSQYVRPKTSVHEKVQGKEHFALTIARVIRRFDEKYK